MTRPPSRRYMSNVDDLGGEEYDLDNALARLFISLGEPGDWEHVADYGDIDTPWGKFGG